MNVYDNMNDRRIFQPAANQTNRPPKYDYISPVPADAQVAMMYIPVQTDTLVSADLKALEDGTIFPVLNKPYIGMGCFG